MFKISQSQEYYTEHRYVVFIFSVGSTCILKKKPQAETNTLEENNKQRLLQERREITNGIIEQKRELIKFYKQKILEKMQGKQLTPEEQERKDFWIKTFKEMIKDEKSLGFKKNSEECLTLTEEQFQNLQQIKDKAELIYDFIANIKDDNPVIAKKIDKLNPKYRTETRIHRFKFDYAMEKLQFNKFNEFDNITFDYTMPNEKDPQAISFTSAFSYKFDNFKQEQNLKKEQEFAELDSREIPSESTILQEDIDKLERKIIRKNVESDLSASRKIFQNTK